MKETVTFHRNPSGSTSQKSARHTSVADDTPTAMDAGKKITGLVKKGGSVVGGQLAATALTTQGLAMMGDRAAPGTLINKAGSVVGPMLLGAVVLGLSKNDLVQMAGIGAVAAGVAAATNVVLKDKTPAYYPGDSGYDFFASEKSMELAGSYEPLQLPAAAVIQPPAIQLVEVEQLS